ncbi:MAG: hypothetical protein QOF13_1518 [Solirubrobacterales bacterium]|nr:hypothetical protein [Solirubrobacterales bacterium]
MRKAFKVSRLMGLLAFVLGLMAFGATAAQAEPGAFWLVKRREHRELITLNQREKRHYTYHHLNQSRLDADRNLMLRN